MHGPRGEKTLHTQRHCSLSLQRIFLSALLCVTAVRVASWVQLPVTSRKARDWRLQVGIRQRGAAQVLPLDPFGLCPWRM